MRQEFKYLVHNSLIPVLRQAFKPHVIRDDHKATLRRDRDYTVRSIYFDSIHLDEYHKKLSGDRDRKKFRIRGYNDYDLGNTVFLEIKRKCGMSISKSRGPVIFRNVISLLQGGDIRKMALIRSDFPYSMENCSRFIYNYRRRNLVPVVNVIYQREAFLFKFDHSGRVTFDKNLRSCIYPDLSRLYEEYGSRHVFSDHFILEIKSNHGFPEWAIPIIGDFSLHRQALSKYTSCIDIHKNGIMKFSPDEVLAFSKNVLFTSAINNNPDSCLQTT